MTRNLDVPDEYAALYRVYEDAYEQASEGKGKERHAEAGEPYENQIICEVTRRVGLGYPLGQAVKKIYESQRLIPQLGVQELLGAINYLAAAVIVMQERMEEEGRRFREGFAHAEGGCSQNGNNQQEFKPGDKVQARLGDGVWRDAVVTGKEITCGKLYYTVKVHDFSGYYSLQADDVRPASDPKAEGCEALVEPDAPQTPEETCQRIVDVNPATYKPRTPTGEELAEIAEEDAHG